LLAIAVRKTGVEVQRIAFAEHRVVAVNGDDELSSDDVDDLRARDGKNPPQLTAKKLMRLTPQIPVGWAEQRKLLGFQ